MTVPFEDFKLCWLQRRGFQETRICIWKGKQLFLPKQTCSMITLPGEQKYWAKGCVTQRKNALRYESAAQCQRAITEESRGWRVPGRPTHIASSPLQEGRKIDDMSNEAKSDRDVQVFRRKKNQNNPTEYRNVVGLGIAGFSDLEIRHSDQTVSSRGFLSCNSALHTLMTDVDLFIGAYFPHFLRFLI